MVKICAVRSCSSRRKNKTKIKDVSSVSFFQPTSQARLEKWSKSLGINLKPSDFVCQLHFNKEDIKFNYKVVMRDDIHCHYLKKKILKKHALPTVEYQEQYYPVEPEQTEDEQTTGKRRRRSANQTPETKRPMEYLKQKLSFLPQQWSYVVKPYEIEFMRIDPVTMKVRNHLILKEDFTIMIVGSNNKQIYLDEQISSPHEIYQYLKYVEDWTPCVGTRIEKKKYSNQCKGIVLNDEASKKNLMYPRCKPCKILRCRLRNDGMKTQNRMPEKSITNELKSESILKQRLTCMNKPMINKENETETVQNLISQQKMTAVFSVDVDNFNCVKQKLKALWSSPQFCGLCYYNGDCCPIYTELIINRQNFSKSLRDIVNYVFNDDVGNLMSSPYICDNCLEKSIQAYIFIHNTRQTSDIMDNAVSDMYSKVTDIKDQLSPSIDYDSAKVMIVLENDAVMYKCLINTKVNEITQTSKPIHMTTELSKNDIRRNEINSIATNVMAIDSSKNDTTTATNAYIKKEYDDIDDKMVEIEKIAHSKIKNEGKEVDTEMTEYETSDTYEPLDDDYPTKFKITKFFPITVPATKKAPKMDSQYMTAMPITVMKELPNINKQISKVPAVKSISKLRDILKTDRNINEENLSKDMKQIDSSVTNILHNKKSPKLVSSRL